MPTIETAESAARTAWNQAMGRHTKAQIDEAADQADQLIQDERGVPIADHDGLGEDGRTAWYIAALGCLASACGEC